MQRQSFHREIGQVVQTQNFEQVVEAMELQEYQSQADFVERTGIKESHWQARAELNRLMREHGFNLPDLTWAHKTKALGWDKKARRWRSQNRIWDLTWGWFFVAICAVMLSAAFATAVLKMPSGGAMVLTGILATLIYGGIACIVICISFVPQKTAARVDRAYLEDLLSNKNNLDF